MSQKIPEGKKSLLSGLDPRSIKLHDTLLFFIVVFCQTLGLVTRIAYIIFYPVPVRDSYSYAQFILLWTKSGSFPRGTHYPPLSIFLMKIPYELFHCDIIKGGTIVNMVLGVLLIGIIIYSISFFNKSLLFLLATGILVATHPSLVDYSCHMTRECSFLVFLTLSLFLLLKHFSTFRFYYLILSSITSSVAFLCRFESIEFCLVVFLSILLFEKTGKRIVCFIIYMFSFFFFSIIISEMIGIPLSYYHDLLFNHDAFFKYVLKASSL